MAERIVHDIVSQGLGEGALLLNEEEMRTAYACGRNTLREALRFLELQGVVRIRPGPGGGPVVCAPSVVALSSSLSLVLHLRGVTFSSVIETRRQVEPLLAREAARHVCEAEVDELRNAIDAMRAGSGSVQSFLHENHRFHDLIARCARNEILESITSALNWILDGTAVGICYGPREMDAVADAHQRILTAVMDADGDAAFCAMQDHIDEFDRYVRARFPERLSETVVWTGGW